MASEATAEEKDLREQLSQAEKDGEEFCSEIVKLRPLNAELLKACYAALACGLLHPNSKMAQDAFGLLKAAIAKASEGKPRCR